MSQCPQTQALDFELSKSDIRNQILDVGSLTLDIKRSASTLDARGRKLDGEC